MKEMQKVTAFFGTCLAGIALCLVMTIYTGVKEHQERNAPPPFPIPTPAMPK